MNLIEPDGTPPRVRRGVTFSQNGAAVNSTSAREGDQDASRALAAVR